MRWAAIALLTLCLAACAPPGSFGQPPASVALSPDVQAYQSSAAQISSAMGDSLDKVQALMGSAQPTDPAWRQQLSQQLLLWHQEYVQAQQLQAPPSLATANTTFVAAMAKYDAAGQDIAAAINSGDAARFDTAKQELQAANQGMQQAHQQLQAAVSQ